MHLCTNPWSMCVVSLCGVRYLSMGLHSKGRSHLAQERMASSGDFHQVCCVQVQEEHHEDIICLKLVDHLVLMVL